MRKKAIIFDLDNTIFPVPQIGYTLFAPLFALIEQAGYHGNEMDQIKDEVMRMPFQRVAQEHNFSETLTNKSIELLQELAYNGDMESYEDYAHIQRLPHDKYIVTTGFRKMQQSKVDRLGLANDFKEIHIIDPTTTKQTKKDVFAEIMHRHGYKPEDVMIVGDDLHSEIKAAQELGVYALWYDKEERYKPVPGVKKIKDYGELLKVLGSL
ncbi:haloacid dehalogenase [Niastella vici]|uniref:Haloacid dehalogenase n=1 Tax=Niastella vici TaxID=1703345 RepID=A0A1V9FS46_9BACT|nr:HAD family hydrolase [Niastella vici]OQP61219.1 haloacid dehalogenase [Niastella vici]